MNYPDLSKSSIPSSVQRGLQAEKLVRSYLLNKGWEVLRCNFRSRGFEIDIVARKGDSISFVEVKYRKDPNFSSLLELLPVKKQQALKRGALNYIEQFVSGSYNARFDLALVFPQADEETMRIRYFENIFQ